MVKDPIRSEIVKQALEEIRHARTHKDGRIQNWHKNEEMYYGKKGKTEDARANVDLARMQEHIHTLLSKIDSPLTFKFLKRKEAQFKRTMLVNALKDYDSNRDAWDVKDIVGKKQCLLYGRAIFSYFASSDKGEGYRPHLENVDVYDFLIDPAAGGIDIERGRYMGRWGVVKDRSELEGNKLYIKVEVDRLLQGVGNNTDTTPEDLDKQNRHRILNYRHQEKEKQDHDKFVFWEWCTTYKGERYYALLEETAGRAIRVEKLSDMFQSNLWPFWTYAAFPDLSEFWTPSFADYSRELFMAQSVSINQMLDNAEQINKPQKVVDVTAIENLADLKYRRGGNYIRTKNGDAKKAISIIETPSIRTPIEVFNTLEAIHQKSSGVTDAAAGVADTDGRATIYEGNAAATADRFGLLNKSYSFGYQRFAKLWEWGVREHLNQKIAVDILGPEGVEMVTVGKRDLFRANEEFGLMVESSNSELLLSEQKKRNQAAYYGSLMGNPLVNQKEVVEQLGLMVNVEPEQIRQLLDVSNFGEASIMSEAERDIELLLDGNNIQPNRKANAAYKQRFVDYMRDHGENIDEETFARMVVYIQSLDEIIVSNTVRQARDVARQQATGETGASAPNQLRAPGPAQPVQDVIQQNAQI